MSLLLAGLRLLRKSRFPFLETDASTPGQPIPDLGSRFQQLETGGGLPDVPPPPPDNWVAQPSRSPNLESLERETGALPSQKKMRSARTEDRRFAQLEVDGEARRTAYEPGGRHLHNAKRDAARTQQPVYMTPGEDDPAAAPNTPWTWGLSRVSSKKATHVVYPDGVVKLYEHESPNRASLLEVDN